MKKLIQISFNTLALAALLLLLAQPAEAQRSQRNPYMPFSGNSAMMNSSFPGDASPASAQRLNNSFSPAFPVNPFDGKLGGGGNDNQPSKLKGIVCYEAAESCLGIYSKEGSQNLNYSKFFNRVDLIFNGNVQNIQINAGVDVQVDGGNNLILLEDFIWQIDRQGNGNWETLSSDGKNIIFQASSVNKKIQLRFAPKTIQLNAVQSSGYGPKAITIQPVFDILSLT
jgi:hypothetical protein